MSEDKYYKFLMANTERLIKEYTYDQLFNMGKSLTFRQRVTFDYKVRCLLENKDFFETVSILKNEKNVLDRLIADNEYIYIINNIEEIIRPNKMNEDVLVFLKKNIDKISKEKIDAIKHIIVNCISDINCITNSKGLDELFRLLDETARKEGLTLFDIKKINYGGFSKIYKIGSKVIKMGYKRVCENIPDNRRLLLPDFKGFVGSDFVEITDYLECCNDIEPEETYQIYKELREQGVRWLDPTELNLARLNETVLKRLREKRQSFDLENVGIIKNDASKEESFLKLAI